jgi:hypothetical protein
MNRADEKRKRPGTISAGSLGLVDAIVLEATADHKE